MAMGNPVSQMLQSANTAGGDNRHRNRITDSASHTEIKTIFSPVAVHAGEQDFTSAIIRHPHSPLHRINASRLAPTMGKDFPARGFMLGTHTLGIDGNHDALSPKTV